MAGQMTTTSNFTFMDMNSNYLPQQKLEICSHSRQNSRMRVARRTALKVTEVTAWPLCPTAPMSGTQLAGAEPELGDVGLPVLFGCRIVLLYVWKHCFWVIRARVCYWFSVSLMPCCSITNRLPLPASASLSNFLPDLTATRGDLGRFTCQPLASWIRKQTDLLVGAVIPLGQHSASGSCKRCTSSEGALEPHLFSADPALPSPSASVIVAVGYIPEEERPCPS